MRRMIANYNLIDDIDELITPENAIIPELALAAHIAQLCGIGSLFTKTDIREFIVRLCLHYGLFNPQQTYFEKDYILSAELKESGEMVCLDPKKLIRFIGLISIEGRLSSASRESFLTSLVTGQRSIIWMEVFSAFSIHRWEEKKNSEDKVVISIKDTTPEISEEQISNAEAFADFIVKDFEEEIFQSFYQKNRAFIKVLEAKEWEIGSVKFDIRSIPIDFLECFVIAIRGEKYFDKALFDAYDNDEYAIEFALMKLAWAVAKGYTEYEYYMGQPVDLKVNPILDFDHDDYDGLQNDDIGGINILQTYIDYGLESVAKYLQLFVFNTDQKEQ